MPEQANGGRPATGAAARPGTPGAAGRRGAGELEAEVLGALWAEGTPLTPSQLHAILGGELAYNTVHTILTRLREKGRVVRTTAEGNAFPGLRPGEPPTPRTATSPIAYIEQPGQSLLCRVW